MYYAPILSQHTLGNLVHIQSYVTGLNAATYASLSRTEQPTPEHTRIVSTMRRHYSEQAATGKTTAIQQLQLRVHVQAKATLIMLQI